MKRKLAMSLRIDENERRMLRQLAKRNGLTVSSWIRSQIHKEARRYGIDKDKEDQS